MGDVAPALASQSFRALVPWLRGFGLTRIRDPYEHRVIATAGHFLPRGSAEEVVKAITSLAHR
ncbi:MAG: hypothetical protein ABIS17_04825 [Casimicrobiaceae bacterium]